MLFSALKGSVSIGLIMLESRKAEKRLDGEKERMRARCLKILIPVAT
jgi:hypothetical protein